MAADSRNNGRKAGNGGRPRRSRIIRTDHAGSILIAVAAEFLLPTGDAAWTSSLLDILGRFEIQPGTTRQALARTVSSQRLLRPEAVGRRKRWRLTDQGERFLRDTTSRAFGFAQQTEDWDGTWLVILASIPEHDRSNRYRLRSRLVYAGLGSPAPGVWVGTHTSRRKEVEQALDSAGISDQARVFVAQHQHLSQMKSMVADAWDLDGIAREYEQFIEDFRPRRAQDPIVRLIELVMAWTRVVLEDPALPNELLPKAWPGVRAATVFLEQHERWGALAMERWRELNDGDPPRSHTSSASSAAG